MLIIINTVRKKRNDDTVPHHATAAIGTLGRWMRLTFWPSKHPPLRWYLASALACGAVWWADVMRFVRFSETWFPDEFMAFGHAFASEEEIRRGLNKVIWFQLSGRLPVYMKHGMFLPAINYTTEKSSTSLIDRKACECPGNFVRIHKLFGMST